MSDITLAATPQTAERPGRLRLWTALGLAVAVDIMQTPATAAWLSGLGGPVEWVLNEGLDVAMMAVLTGLIGFHWSYLPAFLIESLPFVDVAPTWTGSVLLAKRKELRTLISDPRV